MEMQYGYLSRYRADSFNELCEEDGFRPFLDEVMIEGAKKEKFINALFAVFGDGSPNRSHVFYSRDTIEYARRNADAPRRIPVFGVREKPRQVERTLNFYSYYICHPDEVTGPHFFNHVFGTDYITEKEATELSDPIPRLHAPGHQVELRINPSDRLTVCRMVEKLWSLLEEDPANRVIFLLESAKEDSMNLLQQVYMLIPPLLRLEIGFATDIQEMDLEVLFGSEKLPIYVMTMERSAYVGGLAMRNIPIHVIDMTHQEQYTYNQKRMKTLEYLCSIVQYKTDICFRYAEQKVLSETREVISFGLYQKIVDQLMSEKLYWWKRNDLDTIEKVRSIFEEQQVMMDCDALYCDALYAFYTGLMGSQMYADEINKILLDAEYPDREVLLTFLREKLQYGSEIDATEKLIQQLQDEKEKEIKELNRNAEEEKQKALDDAMQRAEDEKRRIKDALEEAQRQAKETGDAKQRAEDAKRQADIARQQAEIAKQQVEAELDKEKKRADEYKGEIEELKQALRKAAQEFIPEYQSSEKVQYKENCVNSNNVSQPCEIPENQVEVSQNQQESQEKESENQQSEQKDSVDWERIIKGIAIGSAALAVVGCSSAVCLYRENHILKSSLRNSEMMMISEQNAGNEEKKETNQYQSEYESEKILFTEEYSTYMEETGTRDSEEQSEESTLEADEDETEFMVEIVEKDSKEKVAIVNQRERSWH